MLKVRTAIFSKNYSFLKTYFVKSPQRSSNRQFLFTETQTNATESAVQLNINAQGQTLADNAMELRSSRRAKSPKSVDKRMLF